MPNIQSDYVLVDVQDMNIITHEVMDSYEAEIRNSEARAVGEIFLQWQPSDSLCL